MRILHPAAWLLCAWLCACTAPGSTTEDTETWTSEVKAGTAKAAATTARGARAVGRSIGTAYHGVRDGFEEAPADGYGPSPHDYVSVIRKHMVRFEGVDEQARLSFGKPVRGYLNEGLLRGGAIEWQGWIVDVAIQTTTAFGQPRTEEYVVRMYDGDVVEVMQGAYAGVLRRVADAPTPVPSRCAPLDAAPREPRAPLAAHDPLASAPARAGLCATAVGAAP